MSVQFARRQAEQLIESLNLDVPPINVNKLAEQLGLTVVPYELGEDVSGLLISNGDMTCIAVNKHDANVRQRFTIAHEIGHFWLRHQFEAGAHVHVDRGNFISKRGLRSSEGVDPKEIEANQFAANLLMPARFVRQAIGELQTDVLLDQHVQYLANKFDVSEIAMTIRLQSLGYL